MSSEIEAKNHIMKISGYINEISRLCKVHEMNKLFIFGASLTADFDNSSDVDFLVTFVNKKIKGSFDRYFSPKEDLELLFELPVDLVCEDPIHIHISKLVWRRRSRCYMQPEVKNIYMMY